MNEVPIVVSLENANLSPQDSAEVNRVDSTVAAGSNLGSDIFSSAQEALLVPDRQVGEPPILEVVQPLVSVSAGEVDVSVQLVDPEGSRRSSSDAYRSWLDSEYQITPTNGVLTVISNIRSAAIFLEGIAESKYYCHLYYLDASKHLICIKDKEEQRKFKDDWLSCELGNQSSRYVQKKWMDCLYEDLAVMANRPTTTWLRMISLVFWKKKLDEQYLSESHSSVIEFNEVSRTSSGASSSSAANSAAPPDRSNVLYDRKLSIFQHELEIDQDIFIITNFPRIKHLVIESLDLKERKHVIEVYIATNSGLKKYVESRKNFLTDQRYELIEKYGLTSSVAYVWRSLYSKAFHLQRDLEAELQPSATRDRHIHSFHSAARITFESLLLSHEFSENSALRIDVVNDYKLEMRRPDECLVL